VSTDGSGGGIGSLPGVRQLRSSEALRITVAVAIAAGAVAIGETLAHNHHRSGGAAPGQRPLSVGAAAGAEGADGGGPATAQAKAGAASTQAIPPVAVAGGPAVTQSLAHGEMVVVVDQPSSSLYAEQNRSIAQGAAVAAGQVNSTGGLPGHVHIELLRQDLDGLSAAQLQARLRADAAAALILPCDTESQLNLTANAGNYKELMLAPCAPDPAAGKRYPTFWSVGTAANDEAAALVDVLGGFGYRNAFILNAPGIRTAEMITGYFRSAAQAKGIGLVGSAPVSTTTPDYAAIANAIKAAQPRPSVIFTALPPPYVDRLAAGLFAQAVYQPVLGTSAMDTRATLAGAKSLEDAIFTSYGFPRESASARRFVAEYRKRFGAAPVGSFPGLGLETVRLLALAAHRAGSAQPAAIQQRLSEGLVLPGVGLASRAYQRGGDHNPSGEVAVSKLTSGEIAPLQAIEPTGAPSP
jgi:ABC-type branched-subunit amino acid transport system substrate-binding protein